MFFTTRNRHAQHEEKRKAAPSRRSDTILTALLFVFLFAALPAWAGDVWDGKSAVSFDSGKGTSAEPYVIKTGAQLTYLAAQVNSGINYADTFFRLGGGIDLNGKPWTPIGKESTPFGGTFDGHDYTIDRLRVDVTDGSEDYGLFGYIGKGGTVKNVKLTGVSITGNGKYVGGLTGNSLGTVETCSAAGVVSGVDGVGGLAGWNAGTVKNCSAAVDVSGNNEVGGLVGDNEGGTVEKCSATGVISGHDGVGGLVGYNGGEAGGTVKDSTASGGVKGNDKAGGLVGDNNSGGTVDNCVSGGNVEGNTNLGALAGSNGGGITNSTVYDDVTVTDGTGKRPVGPGSLVGGGTATGVTIAPRPAVPGA
ncbi:MAG: hypothetical protein LBC93_06125 [Synergistaceae bacterium]|nr:hypothetical protein [Synergistaceae bacterium]